MKTLRLRIAGLSLALVAAASSSHAAYILRMPARLNGPTAATAPASPSFVLTQANVDFGSVLVTETGTVTVTLANTGTGAGAVDIGTLSAPFSLTHDCPATLDPGASCTLNFTFAPVSAGSATASLTVAGQSLNLAGFGDMLSIADVSIGDDYLLVLKTDGSVWAAGHNQYGQLGLGDTVDRTTLTRINSLGNNVAKVSAGYGTSFVVKDNGEVLAAGDNSCGKLGVGSSTLSYSSFTPVPSMGNIASFANGIDHTMVLKNDGTVWGAGCNTYGQLGRGGTTPITSFVQITSAGNDVASISAGFHHTLILKTNGEVWATGRNHTSQLGRGGTTNSFAFVQATQFSGPVTAIAAGGHFTLVIKSDGTVWGVGAGTNGQLGATPLTNWATAVTPTGLGGNAAKVCGGSAFTLVMKNDGSLWVSGQNSRGQLGLNTTLDRSTFVANGLMAGPVADIRCGRNSAFVKYADGSWAASGANSRGELGLGTTGDAKVFTLLP